MSVGLDNPDRNTAPEGFIGSSTDYWEYRYDVKKRTSWLNEHRQLGEVRKRCGLIQHAIDRLQWNRQFGFAQHLQDVDFNCPRQS